MSSTFRRVACVLGVGVGVLYLSNLTAGVFELIPDNLPILGNLDEVGATLLIVRCVREWRRTRPAAVESR